MTDELVEKISTSKKDESGDDLPKDTFPGSS